MDNEFALNKVNTAQKSPPPGLRYLWYSDLYRYTGKVTKKAYLRELWRNPGFRYTFLMRLCHHLGQQRLNLWQRFWFLFFREFLFHYAVKYGISLPPDTQVGPGLYIGHHGTIVVNSEAVIGRNCNLSQGITIGQVNRGPKKGCPTIGDNVYIGPGAVIIGQIKIGDNAAIGANCVVTHDVPDNGVVVGVPGRVISTEGSAGYINRTDY